MHKKFKVGDSIVITNTSPDDQLYYNVGDKGILVEDESDGSWLVDFSGNPVLHLDGLWWANDSDFEAYENVQTT